MRIESGSVPNKAIAQRRQIGDSKGSRVKRGTEQLPSITRRKVDYRITVSSQHHIQGATIRKRVNARHQIVSQHRTHLADFHDRCAT